MKRLQGLVLLSGFAIAAWAFQANAVPTPCDTSIVGKVGGTSNCQLGSTINDTLNPLQVNVDQIFAGGWTFAEKQEYSATSTSWAQGTEIIDIGLHISGNGTSGTWSIANIWADVGDVMLVLQGPNGGGVTPSNYVAYLLKEGDSSDTFSSPFSKTNNKGIATTLDIMHISAYVRGVPEPGPLALLGLALAALGLTGRRGLRRRREAV